MSNVIYLLEKLAHIRIYQLYIIKNKSMKYKVSMINEQCLMIYEELNEINDLKTNYKDNRLKVYFANPIAINECHMKDEKDCLSIKLPFLNDNQDKSAWEVAALSLDDVNNTSISTKEIRGDYSNGLYCKICDQLLCDNTPSKVLPLPSPYWTELTDLWFCHDKQAVESVVPGHDIRASRHAMYIGENHILLHIDSLLKEHVDIIKNKIYCNDCNNLLGVETIKDDVEINKYAIKTLPENVFQHCTLENYLSEYIVATAQARGNRRFVFKNDQISRIIQMMVLSWNTDIQTNDSSSTKHSNQTKINEMKPVVKVMYCCIEKDKEILMSNFHDAHEKYIEVDEHDSLLNCLNASNQTFPKSGQVLGRFFIGYLYRRY